MKKYSVKISIPALNANQAKKVGQLLQNIVNTTDSETKNYLSEQTAKNPNYFKQIASKLKNPLVQKLIA